MLHKLKLRRIRMPLQTGSGRSDHVSSAVARFQKLLNKRPGFFQGVASRGMFEDDRMAGLVGLIVLVGYGNNGHQLAIVYFFYSSLGSPVSKAALYGLHIPRRVVEQIRKNRACL